MRYYRTPAGVVLRLAWRGVFARPSVVQPVAKPRAPFVTMRYTVISEVLLNPLIGPAPLRCRQEAGSSAPGCAIGPEISLFLHSDGQVINRSKNCAQPVN